MSDSHHHGPPSDWLVLSGISDLSDVPDDVRKLSERVLLERNLALQDVAFVAKVRDA
jgi:hypothetical protein